MAQFNTSLSQSQIIQESLVGRGKKKGRDDEDEDSDEEDSDEDDFDRDDEVDVNYDAVVVNRHRKPSPATKKTL